MGDNPTKYCLYARKSSESDERQIMSIDSQIKEMKTIAERDNILIKEIRYESHSAKASGQRPVFQKLIADIVGGEFNGIMTWNPDRLSRNAGDLGRIVDLMDQGKLHEIKTFSQSFCNQPNDKFLLMILCSQAKLENDNKAVNVKRGMRAKCEMGWRPGVAPLGYMNRTFAGVRDIIIDPDRAPIIKEAFDKVAYMYHSGRMAKEWMDNAGFTTRQGKKITTSMIYLMLKNPFYCGYFEYPKGKLYQGKHEPIITKEVFDDTLKEISVPRKIKWGAKGFAFKNMFKCYSCGSSVIGEEKLRLLKNGGHRRHVYYHCTRFKDRKCKEPYLDEKELIKFIIDFIEKTDEKNIHIPEKLKGAMMEYQRLVKDTIFLNSDKFIDDIEVGIKDYAKYILKEGTNNAKRELVEQLSIPKLLHDKKLIF
ncbi:MAG: recombinase family protein [Patescibacteria group bacterium]